MEGKESLYGVRMGVGIGFIAVQERTHYGCILHWFIGEGSLIPFFAMVFWPVYVYHLSARDGTISITICDIRLNV